MAWEVFWYAIKVPFLMRTALWMRFLGLRALGKRMYQAGHDLAYRNSLLLHPRTYMGSIRFLLGSLKNAWSTGVNVTEFGGTPGEAIYEGTERSAEVRRNYVGFFLKAQPEFLVSTGRLWYGVNGWHRFWLTWMVLTVALPPLVLFGFVGKWRARILSYGIELGLAYNLLVLMKHRRVERVSYFCIFEKDSNFTGLVLMKSGLYVRKFSSETPLGCHNHAIVGDEIIYCHPYQLDEWKKFQRDMITDRYRLYIPEQTFLHIDQYREHPPAKKGTLAIYTAGGWIRKKRGDVDQGFGYYNASDRFFEYLTAYIKARPDLKVKLFTHPVERTTPERFADARALYEGMWGADRIEYADPNVRTASAFAEAEVGVAVFSSVIWDRLFCGYKSVYAPTDMPVFPVADSKIAKICAQNEAEFFDLVDQAFAMKVDEWYDHYGLNPHRDWSVLQPGGLALEDKGGELVKVVE